LLAAWAAARVYAGRRFVAGGSGAVKSCVKQRNPVTVRGAQGGVVSDRQKVQMMLTQLDSKIAKIQEIFASLERDEARNKIWGRFRIVHLVV
jgi:hypothetical protein